MIKIDRMVDPRLHGVARDPVSGLLTPRDATEWRAVLDVAGLPNVQVPNYALFGTTMIEVGTKRRADTRTAHQRTMARRKKRGWR